LKYDAKAWTVVRFRMKAPANMTNSVHHHERVERRVSELKKTVPKGFSVVAEPPFAVIGDESPERVSRRASGTVRWAVEHLKKSYFERDPDAIYDIWLFRDSQSYYSHAEAMWGERPDTPYGYASSKHGVLVMNISTGGGTLVHEIVHPFIAANFPACPSWFNEGLASLYEQSAERDGQIVGLTNWRLEGLQNAIERGSLPTFKTLTSTTTGQFYDQDPGSNYAQARYLLYYLQEKGLLRTYYRAFVANQKTDPTGYKTLQTVLGATDMAAFQRDWQDWVMTLSFP